MYGQEAAPVGSDMYKARIAAGLDAYGLPPQQVQQLKATNQYVAPPSDNTNNLSNFASNARQVLGTDVEPVYAQN